MSLADMLITIFILVTIVTLMTGMYLAYIYVYKIQVAYNELITSNNIALDKISNIIKGADKVVDAKNINSVDYTTDYDTLILELPSVDASQNIITGSYDYIVYFRDVADQAKLKYDVAPAGGSSRKAGFQMVGDFVNTLVFNYNNIDYSKVNKVEIILENTQAVRNQVRKVVGQTTTELRNK
jgi:hypothetical protein